MWGHAFAGFMYMSRQRLDQSGRQGLTEPTRRPSIKGQPPRHILRPIGGDAQPRVTLPTSRQRTQAMRRAPLRPICVSDRSSSPVVDFFF